MVTNNLNTIKELLETNRKVKEETMKNTKDTIVTLEYSFSEETGELYEITINGLTFIEVKDHLKALFIYNMVRDYGEEYTLNIF